MLTYLVYQLADTNAMTDAGAPYEGRRSLPAHQLSWPRKPEWSSCRPRSWLMVVEALTDKIEAEAVSSLDRIGNSAVVRRPHWWPITSGLLLGSEGWSPDRSPLCLRYQTELEKGDKKIVVSTSTPNRAVHWNLGSAMTSKFSRVRISAGGGVLGSAAVDAELEEMIKSPGPMRT